MNDKRPILYGMGSPNVRKVGIMLEELELDYELRHVAVFAREQFSSEFRAMNPLGKVPVLVDPALGHPLFESGAILVWLAEHYHAFLPETATGRYEVIQWLMVQMASIGPMFGQLNHFQLLPPASEPYSRGRYSVQAERLYRVLDDRLAGREWIAGSDYSIADMATYPWALYLERHGFDPQQYTALVRWRDAISARPAIERMNSRFQDAFSTMSEQTRKSATQEDLDCFFGRTDRMPPMDYSAVQK